MDRLDQGESRGRPGLLARRARREQGEMSGLTGKRDRRAPRAIQAPGVSPDRLGPRESPASLDRPVHRACAACWGLSDHKEPRAIPGPPGGRGRKAQKAIPRPPGRRGRKARGVFRGCPERLAPALI